MVSATSFPQRVAFRADARRLALAHDPFVTRRQRLVLVAAILGSAVVSVDSSIVGVALPAIERDLGGGLAAQQWVSNAYLRSATSAARLGPASNCITTKPVPSSAPVS